MAIKVHTEVLPNGLTILAESNPANVSAGIGFFVRTGARDETAKESGVSHFLEHMLFKGTPTRSALDINLELGNLGAQANAFTSEENTVYYATVIPEKFKAMQELLSDMMRPALDPEEFAMEKKVILGVPFLFFNTERYARIGARSTHLICVNEEKMFHDRKQVSNKISNNHARQASLLQKES